MKNKLKVFSNIGKVAFFVLCFMVALSFGVARAQVSSNGGNALDQIMATYLQLKLQESPAPPVQTEQVAGIGTRTDIVIVEKTIDMDDVTTTTASTATVVNPVMGDWLVENIIVSSNGYNMASGTFFSIETSNSYNSGTSTLLRTGVGALTASSTLDFFSPTINQNGTITGAVSSTQRGVLRDGTSLVAKCSVADCKTDTTQVAAGTNGKITVTAILRRVDNYGALFD